jgi:uncharacterized protein YuzE
MKEPYLEVTFRHGKPIAAYYYLPRRSGQKSYKTCRTEQGLLIDYCRQGHPIGIEITAPAKISVAIFNRILKDLNQKPIKKSDLAPLSAA